MKGAKSVAGKIFNAAPYDPKLYKYHGVSPIVFTRQRAQASPKITADTAKVQGHIYNAAPYDPKLNKYGITPSNYKTQLAKVEADTVLKQELTDKVSEAASGDTMRMEKKRRDYTPLIESLAQAGVVISKAISNPREVSEMIKTALKDTLQNVPKEEWGKKIPEILKTISTKIVEEVKAGRLAPADVPAIIRDIEEDPALGEVIDVPAGAPGLPAGLVERLTGAIERLSEERRAEPIDFANAPFESPASVENALRTSLFTYLRGAFDNARTAGDVQTAVANNIERFLASDAAANIEAAYDMHGMDFGEAVNIFGQQNSIRAAALIRDTRKRKSVMGILRSIFEPIVPEVEEEYFDVPEEFEEEFQDAEEATEDDIIAYQFKAAVSDRFANVFDGVRTYEAFAYRTSLAIEDAESSKEGQRVDPTSKINIYTTILLELAQAPSAASLKDKTKWVYKWIKKELTPRYGEAAPEVAPEVAPEAAPEEEEENYPPVDIVGDWSITVDEDGQGVKFILGQSIRGHFDRKSSYMYYSDQFGNPAQRDNTEAEFRRQIKVQRGKSYQALMKSNPITGYSASIIGRNIPGVFTIEPITGTNMAAFVTPNGPAIQFPLKETENITLQEIVQQGGKRVKTNRKVSLPRKLFITWVLSATGYNFADENYETEDVTRLVAAYNAQAGKPYDKLKQFMSDVLGEGVNSSVIGMVGFGKKKARLISPDGKYYRKGNKFYDAATNQLKALITPKHYLKMKVNGVPDLVGTIGEIDLKAIFNNKSAENRAPLNEVQTDILYLISISELEPPKQIDKYANVPMSRSVAPSAIDTTEVFNEVVAQLDKKIKGGAITKAQYKKIMQKLTK